MELSAQAVVEPTRALGRRESALREETGLPERSTSLSPKRVLESCADALEFHVALTALAEAAADLKPTTVGELAARMNEVLPVASAVARIDVAAVLKRNAALLLKTPQVPPQTPFTGRIEILARSVASMLTICPIDLLERLTKETVEAELGHRCRLAYDFLSAFVRRHDPVADKRVRAAGVAFAQGRLSLEEVCAVLGLDAVDTIAVLEQHGFAPATLPSLTEEARRALLDAARRDRLERGGKPVANLVDRSVIASQRIEGIDARRWVRGS